MKPVYIQGLGFLSPAAADPGELQKLAGSLWAGDCPSHKEFSEPLEFLLGVPPGKVRRASRYAKMAVAVAQQALVDASVPQEGRQALGTLFLSGYGSVASYVRFAEPVAAHTPSLASPMEFSFMVHNSSLGQVCIVFDLQGPSTMFMGGDPTEYASLLLSEGKAERILCGAIQERDADLCASFANAGQLDPQKLADGAVMLVLGGEPGAVPYGRITDWASAALPVYPYAFPASEEEQTEICRNIEEAWAGISPMDVELIITAGNGGPWDAWETEAIHRICNDRVRCLPAKAFLGEALSVSYMENIALGAAMLRRRAEGDRSAPGCIVAAGMDVHGNYLLAKLEE